uniref:ARL8 protein n=1 Tax=Phaseolus vulgaris TaxID=3885 RepID=I0J8I5_PHAVU|nr:ARL8 protein [Phaseolus vulgaris]
MASSKLLSLALFLVLLTHANSATETSFDFPSFNKDDTNILDLQGDATISSKGFLRLTDDTSNSMGRAVYYASIQIKDNTTGNVANLDTNFTFIIRAKDLGNSGYGLAFVLVPVGSQPDARTVAVVFNTLRNRIDIEVNSNGINWTVATTPCDFGKYNGEKAAVRITYDSSTKDLRVSLLYSGKCDVSAKVQLEKEVHDWVNVGFKATSRFETHDVLSWSFSSKFRNKLSNILLNNIL